MPFVNYTASETASPSLAARLAMMTRRGEEQMQPAAWLRETFNEARMLNASAVVISFHASPDFDDSPDDPDRKSSRNRLVSSFLLRDINRTESCSIKHNAL